VTSLNSKSGQKIKLRNNNRTTQVESYHPEAQVLKPILRRKIFFARLTFRRNATMAMPGAAVDVDPSYLADPSIILSFFYKVHVTLSAGLPVPALQCSCRTSLFSRRTSIYSNSLAF